MSGFRGHVAVIGGGIVGVCCAIAASRDGWRVTLLEPETPGGAQAASYGNGGWISPASIIPMSMPGLWRKVPGYLRDPLGPLTIHLPSLPGLLPWLARFLLAGWSEAKVARTARALNTLLADAPARHAALAAEAGAGEMIRRTGLLYVYPDRAAFEAEALAWRLRADCGVTWTELSGEELAQSEPALSRRYGFAIRLDSGAYCVDPGAYVAALAAFAERLGVRRVAGRATGFEIAAGRLRGVETEAGAIACDRAVIAAGIASSRLARMLGDRIPLAAERGYHVQIASPDAAPRTPMMPSDGKMALTPMAGGLRAAGQVQLAAPDAPPDWRRADVLRGYLRRAFPTLSVDAGESVWYGHRPSTPDGLPVIGPSPCVGNVIYAFGHGHIGLASGPITGRLAADALAGRPVWEAFSPTRF
jgi:D-amino-acid dehydrogenase